MTIFALFMLANSLPALGMNFNQPTHILKLIHRFERSIDSYSIENITIENDFCNLTIASAELTPFKKKNAEIIVAAQNLDHIYNNLKSMYEADKESIKEVCIRCNPTAQSKNALQNDHFYLPANKYFIEKNTKALDVKSYYDFLDDLHQRSMKKNNGKELFDRDSMEIDNYQKLSRSISSSSSSEEGEDFQKLVDNHPSPDLKESYLSSAVAWLARDEMLRPRIMMGASWMTFLGTGIFLVNASSANPVVVAISRLSIAGGMISPALAIIGDVINNQRKASEKTN